MIFIPWIETLRLFAIAKVIQRRTTPQQDEMDSQICQMRNKAGNKAELGQE